MRTLSRTRQRENAYSIITPHPLSRKEEDERLDVLLPKTLSKGGLRGIIKASYLLNV